MTDGTAPAFVVGHGKSGTTLVQALLDGHPQLAVFPLEPYVVGRLVLPTLGHDAESRWRHAVGFLQQLHEHPSGLLADLDLDSLIRAWRRRIDTGGGRYNAYHAGLVLAWAEVEGQNLEALRRWVEKTPEYEKYTDYLFGQWPDARVVHVIRDPRDNFGSYQRFRAKHHPHRPAVTAATFASRWRTSVRLAHRNLRRHGDERYLVLRYEDLVGRPRDSVETLRVFLDIDPDPTLERPTLAGAPWKGNSMHGERFTGIDASSVGRWQSTLDQPSLEALESRLRGPMRRHGYEPATTSPLTTRLRAGLDTIEDEARTLWHRLRPRPPRAVLRDPDAS